MVVVEGPMIPYIQVSVLPYELHALIDWHRNQQYDAANKEQYADAEDHKRRIAELRKLLPQPSK